MMKYAWQVLLLVAFAAIIPFVGTGCSLGVSSKLGEQTACLKPDGAGTISVWMGGTRPDVEEEAANAVTLAYSFQDYHHEGVMYDSRIRILGSDFSASAIRGVGILQFPADITDFSASYDDYQGQAGSITVLAGLPSVPITPTVTLNAEAGQQLVIVRVPWELVPEFGQPEQWFLNTLNFQVNPTRDIQIKAIMAAAVKKGGDYYYLPVCPAATSFAEIPAFDIRVGAGEQEIQFPPVADLPHPGGPQVYNLDTGDVYTVRYFPRLNYTPGTHTEGFGFVNTQAEPVAATFHGYANDGQAVGESAVMNWPAQGQGAYQSDWLLGLSQATEGWTEARMTRGMLGFFLTQWFPWGFLEGLDGANVFTETMKIGVIPRIQMQNGYSTEVRIVNPSADEMTVALQKSYATNGSYIGAFPVPARGALVTDLTAYGSFDGALYLESGHPFIATATIRHGNDCVATANAVAFGERAETLFASHIVLWPGIYSTSINLSNFGNLSDATAEIRPYYANGTPMAAPFNVTVPQSATVTLTDAQLGLPDGASSEGWLEIRSPGKPLAGCITFGDPVRHLYESTLPLQAAGSKNFYYAQVANGDVGGVVYSTGISVVNPSTTTPVNISISVHKSDGTLNGNVVNRTLAPGEKYVRQLSTMEGIGTLENQASGYIHVTAEAPVLSFVLFFDQQANFMSAVQAQSK